MKDERETRGRDTRELRRRGRKERREQERDRKERRKERDSRVFPTPHCFYSFIKSIIHCYIVKTLDNLSI